MPAKVYMSQEEQKKLLEIKREIAWIIRSGMERKSRFWGRAAAKMLCTSRANISRVQTGNVEDISFNQLFRYLVRVEPNFQILISNIMKIEFIESIRPKAGEGERGYPRERK